ncbi:MAG: hopanoid biosynthesis protein HpnM [Alphaproteobacteria bacterium]|nr:hopanoid biosynthesis protein HpnM [Alphaproteobacteria bacterium]
MRSILAAVRRAAAVLLVALLAGAGSAAAGPARDTVDGFYQALLGIMKEAGPLGFDGRYRRIDPAVRSAFNLARMARYAVGPSWPELAPADQERIVDAFSRLTATTYAARFDGFSGERFEIAGERPTQDNGIIVDTRLIKANGEAVTLNYLLREIGGSWRILDIHLSGSISELAVRRSEFGAVLKRDGSDGLVRSLERRIAELAAR